MSPHRPATIAQLPNHAPRRWFAVIAAVWAGLFLLSLSIGTYPIALPDILRTLASQLTYGLIGTASDPVATTVIIDLRLPRALTAILVGAGLGAAGACLQGLFRNPLADPGLIGVSSGGAIGAMAAIFLASLLPGLPGPLNALNLPVLAMAGALATTWLVYRIARISGKTHVSTLLLAGIAINALAGAIVGALLYLSNLDAIRRFTFWTLGSLAEASWSQLTILALFTIPPLLILPRFQRALNAFLLGEAEAWHQIGRASCRERVYVLV